MWYTFGHVTLIIESECAGADGRQRAGDHPGWGGASALGIQPADDFD